jgi:serine/threonine protein kinase
VWPQRRSSPARSASQRPGTAPSAGQAVLVRACQRHFDSLLPRGARRLARRAATRMVRGEVDTPATPAKQLARDVTGKRYLEGQPRASSPSMQSITEGLSNEDNNDEDPANAGTLVMNKSDSQEYQGALPNDPDPRVCWASRNGFTSREAYNDLRAILNLLQNWFIIPNDLCQEKEIDRGSFGSIFAGKLNDVPVAIKHVGNLSKGSSLSYPQVFRAMRLELSIASSLTHPNIVQFHGISAYFPLEAKDDDKFYLGFVFELCSAGSLFSHIHKKGTFKDRGFLEKMVIARDMACGMSYVHEHNIVHRDLSTRNVLLTSNLQVKIADFGCARRIVGDAYDSTTISGSPAYMPPEQLQGRMLTLKVDVWALGVCIWELINEQIPWSDRNCNDRKGLAKHVAIGGGRLRPMPVSKHSPATNGAANTIMEGACQASVEKRFSMAQMYQHLERLVEDCEAEVTRLAADEQRLETLLQRFYSKHNPAKLPEVADLARVFRGRQHVLDERLRSSYKVDLTNFESSGGPDQDRSESDENNRSSVEEEPPPSDVIAERLRLFYLHLNPTKEKVVPALLRKYQGDYKGLNEELFQKYSVDLRTPIDEIKMRSSAPSSSSGVSPNSNMPTPPRAALIRGGSAPPMRESPETSINSWEAEIEPLLTFFFLQLTASKVRDVAEVLRTFRNDSEGLNSFLRKTYGIDLTAPQEKIIQQARTRAQKSLKQAEAAQLETNKSEEEPTLQRQQAEAAAAKEKEVEARQRLEAEARAADEKKQEEASVRKQQVKVAVSQEIANGQTLETSGKHKQLLADIKGQLRRFYIAWNLFEPVGLDEMACKYVLDHEALNALLREKFHGTDLTWTTEDIGQRYERLHSESNKKDEFAEMQEQAEQDRLMLKDLTGKMRQFYASWNVTRSEDELTTLAVKFKQDTSKLNKQLRDRYEGTDLSTDVVEILRIKAEKERKEQEAKETARMEEQRKAEKALEAARLESEKKEQARLEQRKAQEVREAERLARERIMEEQRAEKAKKRLELISMEKLRQQLREFFARWNYVGKPSHDAYIHEMALEYQDNRAELSQKLRDQFYGTDLSSSGADIAAIQHRHAIEQLSQELSRFYSCLKPNQKVEADVLAKQCVGKRSQLNRYLREKYDVDLESTEDAIQKRRLKQVPHSLS